LAQTARVHGIVFGQDNIPLANVNISYSAEGTTSDKNGFYSLVIPANSNITLTFSHITYKNLGFTTKLKKGEVLEFHPVLSIITEQMAGVTVTAANKNKLAGLTTISTAQVRQIPGANAGVENILKSLPGVNSNNELSTQYSVRGGNFDENLVYVNEIEVYRPFLIRSGQQEGLSFINSDLIQNIHFSAGGFQAKYGDKLSSVLDVQYKLPTQTNTTINASLLGASIANENISSDSKFLSIIGLRYRDNSLLVNSKETETNFKPLFADAQTYLTYNFTDKFQLSFLGNIAINDYRYTPLSRQTNFGTITNPIALIVNYQGQELDKYRTYLAAFKANYRVNDALSLKLISSSFHTTEQEYFDILANYSIGTPNTDIGSEDIGEVSSITGIGSQLTHARNDLDALILNTALKGSWTKDQGILEWGLKFTHEDIRDRLIEYEIIDSAGFSIRPPIPPTINNQPYQPFTADLTPFNSVRATNEVQTNRISGYLQYSKRATIGQHDIWYNAGLRSLQWTVKGAAIKNVSQAVISPRAQFSIKPKWKKDMLFRLAAGLYHQAPFYRELRNAQGRVLPGVKAQEALHLVIGNDYSFKMWERPFKLQSEIYYKKLSNVNPYTLENVRLRYQASNNAVAYAQGIDLRLNGEFVPGTDSWVSFGYMKSEENSNDRGYIARPTDQRLKFAVLFQDYVPTIPALKMYLNMIYNTGVPGGSPSYADPYLYQNRLPDYKRADLGILYVLKDLQNQENKAKWLHKFDEMSLGLEIFNIFDVQNSITNTWVRDVASKRQYGIPNYMTTRVFNIKVAMKF
jgi:hypothetical protein